MSRIELKNKSVVVDAEPCFIYSGEVQYYRLPAGEWRDRLEKVAALGLNCIGVYAGWNFHSPEKGVYDFSSADRDFGRFLDEAHRVGLMVIARPGPYVCNEWDLGGFPGWLLREESGDWRTSDPKHLEHCREWYQQVNQHITPRQYDKGGPVILYQVENEHWYGECQLFDALAQAVRKDGIQVPLISNGGGSAPMCGTKSVVDGCDIYTNLHEQWRWRGYVQLCDRLAGDAPLMVIEYSAGLFVQWGQNSLSDAAVATRAEWEMSLTRMFLGQGANLLNHFIIAAGLTPVGYGSDHVTTAYFEDSAISHWGGLGPKFYKGHLLAEAIASVNSALAESRPVHTLWATDNANVEGLLRSGKRGSFVVAVNNGVQKQEFRIALPDGRHLPAKDTISIAPKTSQFLMVDVDCGEGISLEYATAQVMRIWRNKLGLNLVVYADRGTAGHLMLSVLGKPVRVDFTCDDEVCARRLANPRRINVYAVSTGRAQRTWFVGAGDDMVALFSTLDLVRPGVEAGTVRAEIRRGGDLSIVSDAPALDFADVELDSAARRDGLTEYRGKLSKGGDLRIHVGPASYRAEDYSWTTQMPQAGGEWHPVTACALGKEVIANTGCYHYVTSFVCGGELPEYLEFLGISSAEVVVFLNGRKVGAFPDKRPPTYHSLDSYCLRIPVAGVIRGGSNTLAFTLTVIGRHNTGRPILAGISHPIVLYRTRHEMMLPMWEVTDFGGRRHTSGELDHLSESLLSELGARAWSMVDLSDTARSPLQENSAWLDVRWYRARMQIPESMRGRPLFLECSKLDDAWCYVDGKRVGRTRAQMSTTFDLSGFSSEAALNVMIAARYYWAARTALAGAPKLVSADSVVSPHFHRRGGAGNTEADCDAGSCVPAVPSGTQAFWMWRDVTIEIPPGLIAPMYVELTGTWKSNGIIFWNGKAIGQYSEVGPDRRFYVPSDMLKRHNRLSVFIDGYAENANAGKISVGTYAESVALTISVGGQPTEKAAERESLQVVS